MPRFSFGRKIPLVRRWNESLKRYAAKGGMDDFLRPIYYFFRDIADGDILKQNEELRGIYSGHRCFIFGTGPSVDEVDFSLFENEYTLVGSLFYLHPAFQKLQTTFYARTISLAVLEDWNEKYRPLSRYFNDSHISPEWLDYENPLVLHACEPERHYKEIDNALASKRAGLFLNGDTKSFIEGRGLFAGKRVYYVKKDRTLDTSDVITCDLSKRNPFVYNSVSFMIGAAIYMGFKDIYLMGCGYTYSPNQIFHFYDSPLISSELSEECQRAITTKIAAARKLEVMRIDRKDGYIAPVFVSKSPPQLSHVKQREFADSLNVRIWNVVPEGFTSPVFEGVRWKSLRNQLLGKTGI